MWLILQHEIRQWFYSPITWLAIFVLQILLAFTFLSQVDLFLQMQERAVQNENSVGFGEFIIIPLFNLSALLWLFLTPLLTMRLISAERANHSLNLLLTAPLSALQIILGKYFACLLFIGINLCLLGLMVSSLALGGDVDFGQLGSALFGLFLFVTSCYAVGLYFSSINQQSLLAALASFSLLLLFWLLDWNHSDGVLQQLALTSHYRPFLQGRFSSVDVMYFLSVIVTFLFFSQQKLRA